MISSKDLQDKNPEVEFIITTMDEIFNHGRLPVFITAIKAAQQVSGFKYYATFHFVDEAADKLRLEVAPYITYRNHHMVSWEWYLTRGNTFEDYQKELDKYNSIAGAYYNPIGSIYRPSWYRLIMGLEFVEGPLSFQMPWTYYSSLGNPFAWPSSRDSHVFGFYSQEDKAMVSTRLWEACRSGIDDIRYFASLQNAIKANEKSNPQLAKEAKIFYENTMADIPKPQGLPTGGYLRSSLIECPWTGVLSYVYDNEKLQNIRKECAYYILKLNQKKSPKNF